MLSESEILNIVESEKKDSISYKDEIGKKRAILMDYYNCRPYGDEVEGRSKWVSSDVSDVVEGMMPSLLRVFTQSKDVAKFIADNEEYEKEAEQKTELVNYCFYRQNQGVLTLSHMFKDALLQYTGAVKVCWENEEEVSEERYQGLSDTEYKKLVSDDDVKVEESEQDGDLFNVRIKRTKTMGKVKYYNIPPEEFLISREARDFVTPRMIGHVTPKTRSDLVQMGFDKETVYSLPAQASQTNSEEESARRHDYSQTSLGNPTHAKSSDIVELTEMYIYMDVDGDGINELWQVFESGNKILEKNIWDQHPFAVVTPIPIPHRAIGTCPAEQVADIQFMKSVLGRQAADNIYSTNYQRIAYNDRVDLDDLLTPRPGGAVSVSGEMPIGDSISPIITQPQVQQILQFVEYIDASSERRTGFTRYSQGLDAEALNQTATGFKGISEYSQQRVELIARIFAETGVKELFRKTATLLTKYQDEALQIRVTGKPLEIDPSAWRANLDCMVNVGLGSGDRQEKIFNLNNILQRQIEAVEKGSTLSDQSKIYNTLSKLISEVGLKDPEIYFNDPDRPEDLLQAENEILKGRLNLLEQQVQQNPLAEAELIKAQARMAEVNQRDTLKAQEMDQDMQKFVLKLSQEDEHFRQTLIKELTKLELDSNKHVPGALV